MQHHLWQPFQLHQNFSHSFIRILGMLSVRWVSSNLPSVLSFTRLATLSSWSCLCSCHTLAFMSHIPLQVCSHKETGCQVTVSSDHTKICNDAFGGQEPITISRGRIQILSHGPFKTQPKTIIYMHVCKWFSKQQGPCSLCSCCQPSVD